MSYEILAWRGVDLDSNIVSGNPESPTGLFHYTLGEEGGDGPFLGITLKLPTFYSVEEIDFEEVLEKDVEPGALTGVQLVFYVEDAECIVYRWVPVDHHEFWTMKLPDYVDIGEDEELILTPPATVNLIVRQMTTAEYETLVAFDRAGPREEWMDVEFVGWRTGAK